MATKQTRGNQTIGDLSEQMLYEIQIRAHQLYEERCATGVEGDELSDWLRAEHLVREETSG